jgi:transporter family-2 protein
LIPLLVYGGGNLNRWRELPWYAVAAGIFGLVVIGSVSYLIPRIGIAASITTIVAGQLMVGAFLDHYGLLGAVVKPIDLTRVAGLIIVMAGVWLTTR